MSTNPLQPAGDARARFPHLERFENGDVTRTAERDATDALDLIDWQAREIARLNAALMGEHS